jgi:hypothetical protein
MFWGVNLGVLATDARFRNPHGIGRTWFVCVNRTLRERSPVELAVVDASISAVSPSLPR